MSDIFEKENDHIKEYIKHDNTYGYIDCPYCCCHHYIDNYVEIEDEDPSSFKMDCDNCNKEFEVLWDGESRKIEVYKIKS